MRPRFFLIILAVFGTALLLLTMLRPRDSLPSENRSPDALTNKLASEGVSQVDPDNRQLRKGGPQAPTQSARQLSNTEKPVNPGVANSGITLSTLSNVLKAGEERYLEKAIRPIEFYGRVIDEKAEPVEGADVQFSRTYTAPPSSKKSDSNGQFFLTGTTGRYLSVEVSKPGYYATSSNKMSFDYSPELALSYHRPDPNDPVIFHLRKQRTGAELITSQSGVAEYFDVRVPLDGTPIKVDFFNRTAGGQGQLEFSNIKPRLSFEGNPRGVSVGPDGQKMDLPEWSFRLSIPDGGFVEHNDEFPFEAPESGYQPTLDFHFKAGTTNWTDRLQKQFYVAFGQPRKYGRIRFETGMHQGVRLRYAINPDGTRNLESK